LKLQLAKFGMFFETQDTVMD